MYSTSITRSSRRMRIVMFEVNPEGLAAISFATSAAAKKGIQVMDNRWDDKRRLSAAFFDGVTDFRDKKDGGGGARGRQSARIGWMEIMPKVMEMLRRSSFRVSHALSKIDGVCLCSSTLFCCFTRNAAVPMSRRGTSGGRLSTSPSTSFFDAFATGRRGIPCAEASTM